MFIWVLGLEERLRIPVWNGDKGRVSPKVVADPKGLGHETLRVEPGSIPFGRELYTLNGEARIQARSLAGRVEVRLVKGDVWLANGKELHQLWDWTRLDPEGREFVPEVLQDHLRVYREPDEYRTYKVQLTRELHRPLVPVPGVPIDLDGSHVEVVKIAYGEDRYLVTVGGSLTSLLGESEDELRSDDWYRSVRDLGPNMPMNNWLVTVEKLPD